MDLREVVASELDESRHRSLDLLAPVADDDLVRQHSPLMSPLVWDLAHVGNFEELWLLRAIADLPATSTTYDDIYDAFEHPRSSRPSLPLLGPSEARSYVSGVRAKALAVLERVELDPARPLLAEGFVYRMVVQHEHQHDETMLATLQLMRSPGYRPSAPSPPPGQPLRHAEVRVDGGAVVLGTDHDPAAYDNERPAHRVELPAFWIDTAPVTNRAYAEFVEDGGYTDRRWWHDTGWEWRQQTKVEHPKFWTREGSVSWSRNRFGWQEDLSLDQPVQHVCWYEADAYARWAGRRLPTEGEWEAAASWPAGGPKRRYPWGDAAPGPHRANLGQRFFQPAPVGAYPEGVSPWKCHQMLGDVWEWTASDFGAYPGFEAFPYREYSEVFHGSEHKVLKGGSWATHPAAIRATFRNWDLPIRRQIFAGFRCARDA